MTKCVCIGSLSCAIAAYAGQGKDFGRDSDFFHRAMRRLAGKTGQSTIPLQKSEIRATKFRSVKGSGVPALMRFEAFGLGFRRRRFFYLNRL
jgi:hypothetical protein